ncbi:MAG: ferredoxin [Akkermansia sp.]|nr:ferredoxin [Akkermansia sp.]
MAEIDEKNENNVPGKFYVDTNCIACGLCIANAPDYFQEDEDGNSIVYNQPDSDEGVEACESAMADCPVQAIGDDGE